MLGLSKKEAQAREQVKQQAKARRRGRVLVGLLLLTAVVATAPVVVAAAAVCAALMVYPDKLWARVVGVVGLPSFLGAVVLAQGYITAYSSVVAGHGGGWSLAGYGLAAGPTVGAIAARLIQRAREASPLRGEEIAEKREAAEDRRRCATAQGTQKMAHGLSSENSASRAVSRVAEQMAVPLGSEKGPFIGRYLRGDLDWKTTRGLLLIPRARTGHIHVEGRTQQGKSEVVHRLTEWAMQYEPQGQVIYLNAKEAAPGKEPSRRLVAHAESLAKTYNVLVPGYRPYDVMRGSRAQIRQKLMDVELFSEPHHEAGTNLVLALGLEMCGSDAELSQVIQQMADKERVKQWASTSPFAARLVEMIDDRSWQGAVTRYASDALDLAGWIGGAGFHGFGFEDAQVSALDLPTSSEPKSAQMLLRLLLQDITAYLTDARRPCKADGTFEPLTIVLEELSALDSDPVIGRRVVNLMERALGANARFVVVSQDALGLGGEREQSAVLTNATVISFAQVSQAQKIAELAGTRKRAEASGSYSGRLTPDEFASSGSKRMQDQYAVHPNDLRNLRKGECFVFHGGQYAKAAGVLSRLGYGLPDTENLATLDRQWTEARQRRAVEAPEDNGPEDEGSVDI